MKKLWIVLLALSLTTVSLTGCKKEKKESTVIITKKPEPQKPKAIQKTGDYEQTIDVAWVGSTYKVTVERKADETLPIIDDGAGTRYYDNKITVRITRNDNSEFFSHIYTKNDFKEFIDNNYLEQSAMLGVVFDKAEENELIFVASVGSPDNLSDEYVPMVLKISRMGKVTVSKALQLEEQTVPGVDEDEGV